MLFMRDISTLETSQQRELYASLILKGDPDSIASARSLLSRAQQDADDVAYALKVLEKRPLPKTGSEGTDIAKAIDRIAEIDATMKSLAAEKESLRKSITNSEQAGDERQWRQELGCLRSNPAVQFTLAKKFHEMGV